MNSIEHTVVIDMPIVRDAIELDHACVYMYVCTVDSQRFQNFFCDVLARANPHSALLPPLFQISLHGRLKTIETSSKVPLQRPANHHARPARRTHARSTLTLFVRVRIM